MQLACEVHRLGVMDYEEAWALQILYADEIAGGNRPPTLLLLEHPHTYTFGRRGKIEHLLWDEAELTRRGITVQWVDRGGDVTYHGPGQLVGYPLLPLAPGGIWRSQTRRGQGTHLPQADYVGYIRDLEKALILALLRLGVTASQLPGLSGVWIQPDEFPDKKPTPAKIAAIGVKVDAKGVSRHGFALNINPDMRYWQGIIGCGIKDYPVTSLAELVHPVPDMDTAADAVIRAFGEVFGYRMVVASQA